MTKIPCRNHTAAFKAQVALAADEGGEDARSNWRQQFDVHPNQITQWKVQLFEGAGRGVRQGQRAKRRLQAST